MRSTLSMLRNLFRPRPETTERTIDLPGLTLVTDPAASSWLSDSIRTFAISVSSFVPPGYPAYARIYPPLEGRHQDQQGSFSWTEYLRRSGSDLNDLDAIGRIARNEIPDVHVRTGDLPRDVIELLLPHLRASTRTPEKCYFALWEGGGIAVSSPPTLALPHRGYHVFSGALDRASTNFYGDGWPGHLSPNLWWPEDRAWCIATEVDQAWTYLAGSWECVEAIRLDDRIEASLTSEESPR